MATEKGHTEMIQYLLKKGANINEKDFDGRTALIYAAEDGQLEIVKCLIENGANIEERDKDNRCQFHQCFTYNFYARRSQKRKNTVKS